MSRSDSVEGSSTAAVVGGTSRRYNSIRFRDNGPFLCSRRFCAIPRSLHHFVHAKSVVIKWPTYKQSGLNDREDQKPSNNKTTLFPLDRIKPSYACIIDIRVIWVGGKGGKFPLRHFTEKAKISFCPLPPVLKL